ncbi:ComEC/Rec2 family competence protein [Brevibacterium daeguense]|uniref:ComEC/Rec2 family competence protein n=1 Tax=Brevibacterium daeguense TaxID=909936 RepID=A0ABP8EN08_9MICO
MLSVVLIAGAAGTGVSTARTTVPGEPQDYSGAAIVLTDPRAGPSGSHTAAADTGIGQVTVISREPLPPAGTRIQLRAQVRVDTAGASAFVDSARPTSEPARLWRLRATVREFLVVASGAAHDGSGLVPGLVVGETGGLAPGLEEDMRTVSLSHLTAVSGSNITIVALAVMWLVARVTPRRLIALGTAVAVTAAYVFVVGPEPSVTRAAAMGLVGAAVLLRGSGTRGLAVLSSAVMGVLIYQPSLASSPGFHLSVAATAALVTAAPRLTELLVRFGVPYFAAAALAVPITAQIGVTPVLLGIGGTMSAWAVPANILAAPLVAPATVLGLLVLLLGAVEAGVLALPGSPPDSVAQWFGLLGGVVAAPASWCAWWIARLARVGANLPAAVWPWPHGATGIVLAVGMAAGLAVAVLVRHRRALPVGSAVIIACLVVGTLVPVLHRQVPGDWRVLVCDVGQGSATVVRLPDRHVLLIDTGPERQTVDGCLAQAGAQTVHLLISHFDADHSAGYPGVLTGRSLGSVQRSESAGEHRRALAMEERVPDVPVTEVAAGDVFRFGEVSWEVLWPEPGARGDSEESNAMSVVVRVVTPELTMIVPGDIGEAEQRRLAPRLSPADVLIAPHHGSGDLSEDFYAAADAQLGIVSVGADNSYGHPSSRSLEAFARVPVLRTDECGTIAIDAGLQVSVTEKRVGCAVPVVHPTVREG